MGEKIQGGGKNEVSGNSGKPEGKGAKKPLTSEQVSWLQEKYNTCPVGGNPTKKEVQEVAEAVLTKNPTAELSDIQYALT
jgi:hypothetical protein